MGIRVLCREVWCPYGDFGSNGEIANSETTRYQNSKPAFPGTETEPGPFTRPGSVVPGSQPLPGHEQTSEQYNPMGPVSL